MSKDVVTISIEEYSRLQDAEDLLFCLYAAGVDSWEGFDIAIEEFHKEADEDE